MFHHTSLINSENHITLGICNFSVGGYIYAFQEIISELKLIVDCLPSKSPNNIDNLYEL
jgi:hypothetical protein